MKKFIILVLLVALGAAAYYTRPQDPKKNFAHYLSKKMTGGDSNPAVLQANRALARHYAEECTYNDRYLWVDVKRNDKTIYTGAFSHWFDRAQVKQEVEHDLQTAKEKAQTGLQQLGSAADRAKDKRHDEVQHFGGGAEKALERAKDKVTETP